MRIDIYNFMNESDKKKFVASIYSAFNEHLANDKCIDLRINPNTDLRLIGDSLRGIAEIIDCAKDMVVGPASISGDDDEDAADWWTKKQ